MRPAFARQTQRGAIIQHFRARSRTKADLPRQSSVPAAAAAGWTTDELRRAVTLSSSIRALSDQMAKVWRPHRIRSRSRLLGEATNRVVNRTVRRRAGRNRIVAANLAKYGNVRCEDRQSVLHRFDQRQPEPFAARRENQRRRVPIGEIELGVRPVLEPEQPPAMLRMRAQPVDQIVRHPARPNSISRAAALGPKSFERSENACAVLARLDRPDDDTRRRRSAETRPSPARVHRPRRRRSNPAPR